MKIAHYYSKCIIIWFSFIFLYASHLSLVVHTTRPRHSEFLSHPINKNKEIRSNTCASANEGTSLAHS